MRRMQRATTFPGFNQPWRSLSYGSRRREIEYYPQHFKTTLERLNPEEQDVFKRRVRELQRLWPAIFTEEDLYRSVVTQKLIAIVSARKPNDPVLTMMLDLAGIFNALFVVDQSDDFIKFLLQTNKSGEIRCPEILSSRETLKAFLNSIHEYRKIPDKIGCVLEALLSALGKTMYQIDGKLRRNPKPVLDRDEETLLNIMNKYAFQSFYQPYLRGPEGYFFDVDQSVVPNEDSIIDGVKPDLDALKTIDGAPLKEPCRGYFFNPASTGWIGHAVRGGIPLQYGPSGSTGASLTAICLLMRSQGVQNFAKQDLDEIMPLIVHTVMLPYLLAGYHSFTEVMVAARIYHNRAQEQTTISHSPLFNQRDALHFVGQSMQLSPDRSLVEKLSHTLNTYYEFYSQQYSSGREDDSEPQPPLRP